MSTKKNKQQEFVFFYVCEDGRAKTFMNSIYADRMSDAVKKAESFIESTYKREGKPFTATSIASLTVMPKPAKGRKSKKNA